MEAPIALAARRAEALLKAVSGGPVPGGTLREDGVWASPGAFRCAAEQGTDVAALAAAWCAHIAPDPLFDRIWAQNGYVNFCLGPAWCRCAAVWAETAAFSLPPMASAPKMPDFWAEIDPFDWAFLWILTGRPPKPERAARRDGENPGWLSRYEAGRMELRGGRDTPGEVESDRRILLRAAACGEAETGKALAASLTSLARTCRAERPGPVSARAAASVLTAGIQTLKKF